MKNLLFILVIICGNLTGSFSAYGMEKWSTAIEKIPIPNTQVNDIAKDTNGRIWLITDRGLLLYDGFESILLPGIPTADLQRIYYEEGRNRMWVCSSKEIWWVNCGSFKAIKRFQFKGADAGILSSYFDAARKELFLGLTNGEIYRLASEGNYKLILTAGAAVRQLVKADGDTLFFISNDYLYRYIQPEDKLTVIKMPSTGQPPYYSGLWYSRGQLFINCNSWHDGLAVMDTRDLNIHTPPELKFINDMNKWMFGISVTDTTLLISYDNYSFYYYNRHTNAVINISARHTDIFYGKKVYRIYSDGNTVWLGTNQGMVKLSIYPAIFPTILSQHHPVLSTRSILKSEGELYITSYSGIFRQDKNGEWENLNDSSPAMKEVIPYIALDGGDKLYIGGESPPQISIYHKKSGVLKTVPVYVHDTASEKARTYAMAFSPEGKIWIGGNFGIRVFDTVRLQVSGYPKGQFDVQARIVGNLFFDSVQRQLYAATKDGLFIFSENGKLICIINGENTEGLHSDKYYFVTRAPDGLIWLGTSNDGLYMLDEGKVVKHLSVEDGLSDPMTYGVLFDSHNRAWISTNNGLSCYYIKEGRFYNYYSVDGLSADEFNFNSLLKDKEGLLYFGGINGVNTIRPESANPNPPAFKLFVSGIKKWSKKGMVILPYVEKKSLVKDGDDYSMSVMLGTSDYDKPKDISFYYHIEGVTRAWEKLPSFSHVFQPDGFSYGTYNVRIKAVNYRGAVSNILSLRIQLLAPVYYRRWFILLIIGCIAGIAYAVAGYRIKGIKKYERLRIKIASDLHDEVGGLLTGIGMYSDNLSSHSGLNEKALTRAGKISVLSRQAIASMRDILWSIDARNDSLQALEEQVRSFAEAILTPMNVSMDIRFEKDGLKKGMEGDIRQHLYFFAKEAINNIAKHSEANYVEIKFQSSSSHFHFLIRNNGATKPIVKSGGQGLKNMQMRAAHLKASFYSEMKDDMFTVEMRKGYA